MRVVVFGSINAQLRAPRYHHPHWEAKKWAMLASEIAVDADQERFFEIHLEGIK